LVLLACREVVHDRFAALAAGDAGVGAGEAAHGQLWQRGVLGDAVSAAVVGSVLDAVEQGVEEPVEGLVVVGPVVRLRRSPWDSWQPVQPAVAGAGVTLC